MGADPPRWNSSTRLSQHIFNPPLYIAVNFELILQFLNLFGFGIHDWVKHNTVLYATVLYSTVVYGTVLFSTICCGMALCSTGALICGD